MQTNKVIPFPAPQQPAAAEANEGRSRVLVQIGKQVVAIDIACRATVITPQAAPASAPQNRDDERRQEHRP